MKTKSFSNPASDTNSQSGVARQTQAMMKHFQTVNPQGSTFDKKQGLRMKKVLTICIASILVSLLPGCGENSTGPDYTISSQSAAQMVMSGEPSRTVIYASGSPSILLITGNVENVGGAPAYYVRVRYTQRDECGSCGTSPLMVEPGQSASFAMQIDMSSIPQGTGSYDITWRDNP
jgi:hypothetical protein